MQRAAPRSEDVSVLGRVSAEFAEILTLEALDFIADLHRQFEPQRQDLLARRAARQKEFDRGKLPDFLPDTRKMREQQWRVAPQPKDLLDRRVELTGPTDRKMVINALNSGASTFMADFEDANCPTWHNMVDRSEEHTSELQSLAYLVCRLLLEKKKKQLQSQPRDQHEK